MQFNLARCFSLTQLFVDFTPRPIYLNHPPRQLSLLKNTKTALFTLDSSRGFTLFLSQHYLFKRQPRKCHC
ncbi:hypothetical protein Y032_1505g3900 [Ancylostoma ceylanicum]|uniref:Uncharacterized protein n=1 Tax=Ancylostoma ceylanicum TaxID=53326 RepID=A0A016W4I3_9BILA|nr:hypothetical protein Y032_1505g3900 [Ancylostoma ceylanicum]